MPQSLRSLFFQLRVTAGERRRWRAAAKRNRMTVSAWLVQLANTAAPPPPPRVPPVIGGDQLELRLGKKGK